MEKQIDVSGIERLEFYADAIYNIKIATAKSTSLIIRTHVEGEYAENVVLDIKQQNSTLNITPGFTPFFNRDNDKLAAHKVIAITLDVIVPENLFVTISSKIASLECHGNYQYFQAYLNQGTCVIKNFKGNGKINTKIGDISILNTQDVGILAISEKGIVTGRPYQEQFYNLKIKTVSGDITILETN
ncbi:hypothetical protein SCB49_06792 [unidentified eubacterium SCB49]|nr:hypothetical protein SCB49_06792 [unidentified eubacterium SCB49]